MTGTPPLLSVSAFHCQQAAEKLLKAALVRAGVRPRKTHDLTSLADEAARILPALTPVRRAAPATNALVVCVPLSA